MTSSDEPFEVLKWASWIGGGLYPRTYAHFTARRTGLRVTVYEKDPRMLVQGNEAGEFARELLEPLVGGGNRSSLLSPCIGQRL